MISGDTLPYTKITLREFLDFLKYEKLTYTLTSVSRDTKEYIFNIPASPGSLIRVFSSVDIRSKVSRDIGKDAIRLVLIDKESNLPITKGQKTLRMFNWKDHLSRKIKYLLEYVRYFERKCPFCDSFLTIREGDNGPFWGCSEYPNCKYTAKYNEPGKNPIQRIHQEWIFELNLSEAEDEMQCPACMRRGYLHTFSVRNDAEEITHWDATCGICGTRGKIINDKEVWKKNLEDGETHGE